MYPVCNNRNFIFKYCKQVGYTDILCSDIFTAHVWSNVTTIL